ncbi:hypothetical protein C8J98_103401 [Luteibacter sp. OK325]|nr:hypothetical protein C8J98_103401 [Luteibacter sp. OK325]
MMQNATQALNAAIAHFATQPGVTQGQVDQLRSALYADPGLLTSFNNAAASGTVKSFALETSPAQQIPAGRYDMMGGVVSLPASSFASAGPTPAADLHSVLHVQAMVVEFAAKSYVDGPGPQTQVSSDMVVNLQDTLNGSPVLSTEIKRAAMTPDPADPKHRVLEAFDIVPSGSGLGGSYSPEKHTMNLPAASLQAQVPGSRVMGYNPYELSFVIGHEVQHGFNSLDAARGRSDFIHDAQAIAATRSPVHDYTLAIEKYVQSGRNDEARAEISGWNALQSRVHQENPSATLYDMYNLAPGRVDDFAHRVNGQPLSPRPNVQLNADLTMSPTSSNVAAMGHNYFDRPNSAHMPPGDTRASMNLGGVSDYPNYYARWAVATASWAEQNAPTIHGQKPQIVIDMAHAGLYEDMMERSGMNLGPSKQPVPYLDSSHVPATAHQFDHTFDGANKNKFVPSSPSAPSVAADSALHRELRNALPSETSQDRLAQIALAAKEGGIEAGRIRTMDVVGTNLMLTGVTPGTNASIDLASPPPPVDVSNNQFNALSEQQRSQVQQMHVTQQQAGPTMSMHQ